MVAADDHRRRARCFFDSFVDVDGARGGVVTRPRLGSSLKLYEPRRVVGNYRPGR